MTPVTVLCTHCDRQSTLPPDFVRGWDLGVAITSAFSRTDDRGWRFYASWRCPDCRRPVCRSVWPKTAALLCDAGVTFTQISASLEGTR